MAYSMKNFKRVFALSAGLWAGALAALTCKASAVPPITGVYRLTTQAQPGLCLSVANSSNSNGAALQLATANQTANQQWLVEAQGDGSYKIYAYSGQNSLQMLDANSGAYGSVAHIWEDLGVINQLWYFMDMGNGYYRIIPKSAGSTGTLTLDLGQGDPVGSAGETADIWTYWGGGNQLFKLDWAGPTKIISNPKKGVPGRNFNAVGLHCAWTYDWGAAPTASLPGGIEYVPMVWGWSSDPNIGKTIVQNNPGMKNVLAYNEPDGTYKNGGAQMPLATSLTGFQYLSPLAQMGIGVGSPACVDDMNSYMGSFMDQAVNPPYNYHIDFVCVHIYPGADPNGFLSYIDKVHARFNKPIWVTEFAPADWSGHNGVSVAQATAFLRAACQGLNSRPYVLRYSFFTSQSPSSPIMGSSALVNDDGTFTALGQLYSRL